MVLPLFVIAFHPAGWQNDSPSRRGGSSDYTARRLGAHRRAAGQVSVQHVP